MNNKTRWIVERRIGYTGISNWHIQYSIILPVDFWGFHVVEFYELDITTGELIKLCTIHNKKKGRK
jgi:hypothetical protein